MTAVAVFYAVAAAAVRFHRQKMQKKHFTKLHSEYFYPARIQQFLSESTLLLMLLLLLLMLL